MSSQQYEIHNILKRARTLDISRQFSPYSGVEILTGLQDDDGNDIIYYAPSNPTERSSGRVLTVENPWGTQAQADAILTAIKGYAYQPFEATDALVDPSAEIGDGVSVNDVYSGIFKMSRNYSALMPADVAAPQSEEIDHEYPYESMADRSIERRFSAVESEFRIQSGEIAAKVSEVGGASNNVSWSLKSNAWTVYANGTEVFKVDRNGATVTGTIKATAGKIGGFDIGANAISYNGLNWGGSRNGIYLGTSGIQLGSASGSFFQASSSGVVKASNMTLTGTLTIGGQQITANALRSGAQSAYSNGGAWTRGAGYGDEFHGMITANSETGGLKCNYLRVASGARFQGYVLAQNGIGVGSGGVATWQTKTISGVTINYLGK